MEADHTTAAPPDPNEGFLRLWTHHEPELRAFVHACLPRAAEVDEVMQAVSLVALRKFSTLTEKLLAYALCRQLEGYDEIVVDHLMERIAKDGYRMQTLISEIATSYPFTNHCLQENVTASSSGK